MPPTKLPSSPIATLRTIELTSIEEPLLQRFFEANPQYFLSVNGEPAHPNEASEEIHGELPIGWSFTKKWLIGYVDAQNELVAMVNIVSDLLSPGVWHIGLFVVATSRHGSGYAQTIYRGLETWAIANGAQWLRLGVVQGNTRAERFWESLGYIQTRTRDGVAMGKLRNTIRVMVKALAEGKGQGKEAGSLESYLLLIARDRPE
jgi:GNAT superfamily N-acetyltransferase